MYDFGELQIRKYNEPGVAGEVIYYKIVKKYLIGGSILKRPTFLFENSPKIPVWKEWCSRSLKQAYDIAQNWEDCGFKFKYTLKSNNELTEVIPFKNITETHSMELI